LKPRTIEKKEEEKQESTTGCSPNSLYGCKTDQLNKTASEILKSKGGVVRVLTVAPTNPPTIPRGSIPDSPYED
jgi:hypothetical protein